MSFKIWGGKMKWQIFRDNRSLVNHEYEYEYWNFISDDSSQMFPVYTEPDTEIHDVVKEFTEEDMYDFGEYIGFYSIDVDINIDDIVEAQNRVSEEYLHNFVLFDWLERKFTVDDIYDAINNDWAWNNDGSITTRITGENISVSAHKWTDSPGLALLKTISYMTGKDFEYYDELIILSDLKYDNIEDIKYLHSVYDVIAIWDNDNYKEVTSISYNKENETFTVSVCNTVELYDYNIYTIKGLKF